MFKPYETERTITLCSKTFKVYSLEGFNFNTGLYISSEKGLYCFTRKIVCDIINNTYIYNHILLYLGKADGEQGIDGRLIRGHEKFDELKKEAACICIYTCDSKEDSKTLESTILGCYDFKYNKLENQQNNKKPFTVTED